MARVFIGVGHGGSDPGAVANGMRESDINLVMAVACRDELARHGVTVGISRTREENDPLRQEIDECNAFNPDLAVECHNNAGFGDGFEVFVYPGSTKARKLAECIEAEVKAIGQNSRGIKTSTALGWVREVNAPCVLCEGFFLDNKKDAEIGNTFAKQRKFGVAYAKGVLKMLGIAYVPATSAPVSDRARTKARFGFNENTMKFLDGHRFKDALFARLANTK